LTVFDCFNARHLGLALFIIITTLDTAFATPDPVIEYQYRVLTTYPHDTNIFTQGLEFHQGVLYESAGQTGRSMLLTRALEQTPAIQQHRLRAQFFAEGITVLNKHIYQLTWKSQRGFIYDQDTLQPKAEFSYKGEGWGITNDGEQLIISNGSHQLQFIDPMDFSLKRTLDVKFENKPLHNINELEWVDGLIYANIWQSNWIVMIDPHTGHVVGKVSLKGLLPDHLRTEQTDVLNGIAYDRNKKRLLVTGKNWPQLFHIELIPNLLAAHKPANSANPPIAP
jgi:glutamine cyclotransferase